MPRQCRLVIILGCIDGVLNRACDLLTKGLLARFEPNDLCLRLTDFLLESQALTTDQINASHVTQTKADESSQALHTISSLLVLQKPDLSTVRQLFSSLLTSSSSLSNMSTHVVFVGQMCQRTGAWMLTDGLFTFNDLVRSIAKSVANTSSAYQSGSALVLLVPGQEPRWKLPARRINVIVEAIVKESNVPPNAGKQLTNEVSNYVSQILSKQATKHLQERPKQQYWNKAIRSPIS